MLRSLQTAATGMDAQQRLVDTLSNNIANVNTTAFKKSRPHFNDLLYQNTRAPGLNAADGTIAPSGIQVGNGVRLVSIDKNFEQGAVQITGKDTDFMIRGRGFFRVQMPDGQVGYTRDGAFERAADGRVVTKEGFPVVPEIIIPAEATDLRVGMDGTVTIKVPGEVEARNLGQMQIANFINPAGMESIGRNLYLQTPASGEPLVTVPGQNSSGLIGQGELETSNVNIVDEMVQMIQGQRAYELNSKVIKTSDEMLASTNQMR